jgi:hypothetical protein
MDRLASNDERRDDIRRQAWRRPELRAVQASAAETNSSSGPDADIQVS